MQALEAISFDTAGFDPEPRIADPHADERGAAGPSIRGWTNEFGDTLTAHFFQIPPDLPTPFRSVEELRDFHRPRVAENGGGLIHVEVYDERGMFVQDTLYKFLRGARGAAYAGTLTFPFAQFSYVLKIQCLEQPPTGVREATILQERLAALGGKGDPRSLLQGWMKDPYLPDFKGPSLRSEAEDERFDARFPNHPLTRARKTLLQLRRSVQINRALLKVAKPFPRSAAT